MDCRFATTYWILFRGFALAKLSQTLRPRIITPPLAPQLWGQDELLCACVGATTTSPYFSFSSMQTD